MVKKSLVILLSLLMIMLLAACGGGGQAPAAAPVEEQPVDAAPAGETGGESQPVAEASPAESEVPEDVPLMDGAYDLDVGRKGTQIAYKVDATIADVVTFYQEALAALGWENAGPPDSAMANIANIIRQNSNGDRLSIAMQFNPNASFTVLTITVNRK
jgi:hypothetical protein